MSRALAVCAVLALAGCASAPQSPPQTRPQPVTGNDVPPVAPVPGSIDMAAQGPFLPDLDLTLCAGRVSNAPAVDAAGRVRDFAPLIVVNSTVILATVPTNAACLSSGFGPRNGRDHDGIDLRSRPASLIYSGGPGTIREIGHATGYGRFVVIDHGSGVFTRYAHLANFTPTLVEGAQIGFGQPLGLMGETGNATAIHLHYEVLIGQWGARRSYGLTPTNVLSWPAYDWESASG